MTAADRVLGAANPPSALFVSSDRIAIGTTHRLLARGVRVPEDIALVSYDNIPYAILARVPGQSPVSAVRWQGICETTPDSLAPGVGSARLLS